MKVSYANLKLKTDTSVKTFKFNDTEIEILNYLPIEDKYDLIMVTLQKAKEGSIYNSIKLDVYFHLNLVYMYTNLSFTDKQREDELKIYDNLKSNGFMDLFLEALGEKEYNELFQFMTDEIKTEMKYNLSMSGVISKIITDLPKNAEAAMDIVNNFDKSKFQEVIDFAQAANGGRPIA
jgi:hypothetical protein